MTSVSLTLVTMAMAPPVKLSSLLSTCVDACQRGCEQIRTVQSRRDLNGLAVDLKEQGDPRSALTEADTAAQVAIVGALRAQWPGICVVGEEDEPEPVVAGAGNTRGTSCTTTKACEGLRCQSFNFRSSITYRLCHREVRPTVKADCVGVKYGFHGAESASNGTTPDTSGCGCRPQNPVGSPQR